jgi:hypothetical protein
MLLAAGDGGEGLYIVQLTLALGGKEVTRLFQAASSNVWQWELKK